MTFPDTAELATALRAVAGVADVTVVPADLESLRLTAGADAGTVRLVLLAGADEAAVVAEANRVLRERFGLGVDTGQVRLVEDSASTEPVVNPRPAVAAGPATPAHEIDLREIGATGGEAGSCRTAPTALLTRAERLLIQRMQLVSGRNGVSVAVTLAHDEATHVGESSGAASESAVHRSVAEATLRAVESVAGGRATFALEDVAVANLGPERVVLTRVLMSAPWGSEKLTGASTVREDVRQAVIRATLDSLNRRIEAIIEA